MKNPSTYLKTHSASCLACSRACKPKWHHLCSRCKKLRDLVSSIEELEEICAKFRKIEDAKRKDVRAALNLFDLTVAASEEIDGAPF